MLCINRGPILVEHIPRFQHRYTNYQQYGYCNPHNQVGIDGALGWIDSLPIQGMLARESYLISLAKQLLPNDAAAVDVGSIRGVIINKEYLSISLFAQESVSIRHIILIITNLSHRIASYYLLVHHISRYANGSLRLLGGRS